MQKQERKLNELFRIGRRYLFVSIPVLVACLVGSQLVPRQLGNGPLAFSSIANRPNQSMERLSNWLIEPHAPTPNIHLTRKEIRDLAGYILSPRGPP